jgi:hypothetical protein
MFSCTYFDHFYFGRLVAPCADCLRRTMVSINGATAYQVIDGFSASDAFFHTFNLFRDLFSIQTVLTWLAQRYPPESFSFSLV